jgi:hypothetical protein
VNDHANISFLRTIETTADRMNGPFGGQLSITDQPAPDVPQGAKMAQSALPRSSLELRRNIHEVQKSAFYVTLRENPSHLQHKTLLQRNKNALLASCYSKNPPVSSVCYLRKAQLLMSRL